MDGPTTGGPIQVRLLGPVDVVVRGAPRPVSGLRRQAVLAVLALRAGEVVGTDRLIDAVWGDDAPPTALNTLQSHVSYLRSRLGSRTAVAARASGYVLDIDGDMTDVRSVERLRGAAARTSDPAQRALLLGAALTLRRGPPLGELAGLPWFDRQAERLDTLLLDAEVALADARLDLGEYLPLVADLARLAEQRPLDERIHGGLMLALYRSGRQAEALEVYQRLSRLLDEDLGVLPGPALRDLHRAVLRQDEALRVPYPPPAPAVPSFRAVVPAQLPPMVAGFAGRGDELARLDALLDRSGPPGSDAPVLVVVSGTPGVGKTALAVRWGHRVAPKFPDGQLYVNLRGFDDAGAVMEPGEAVRGFLDALRVPPERVPAGSAEQTALFRSLLAGRRMLLVLDNVRDADQVRPLLPGATGCATVVTSRDRLTPLVVTEGAVPLGLGLLAADEARDLLSRRLGGRVDEDPAAADELVNRCARLPLALAITAAHAATNPDQPLSTVARQLRDAEATLDALHGGDPATDVRAVFSWSYQALRPDAARLFRLLALHPGPDSGALAAASLIGRTLDTVRPLVRQLTGAHLLTQGPGDRFSSHDLLRLYAAERLQARESATDQGAARRRLLDHYLRTAHAADALLHPQFSSIELPVAAAGTVLQPPADATQAQAWFRAELPSLPPVVRVAARTGFDTHAWQLAWAMAGYLDRSGHWAEWLAVQTVALDAARRTRDRIGQAHAHRELARVCSRLARPQEAWSHAGRALALFETAGDRSGQASTHLNLGQLLERRGELPEALRHSRAALRLYESTGHAAGQAYTLNAVGWQHALLGDYPAALAECGEAAVRLRVVGDRTGEGDAWDSLGYVHHHLGDHGQAIRCYRRAVELFEVGGDRYPGALALDRLGDSQLAAGRPAAARAAWEQAVAVFRDIGHADVERPLAKLARSPADPV